MQGVSHRNGPEEEFGVLCGPR